MRNERKKLGTAVPATKRARTTETKVAHNEVDNTGIVNNDAAKPIETIVTVDAVTLETNSTTVATPETGAGTKRKQKSLAWITRNTGAVLHTIHPENLTPASSEVSWTQEPELLCSYNWDKSETANNILVPGGPPKWTPRALPYTLPVDTGFHCMDYNHVRQPRFPWNAMFKALDVMNPSVKFNDIHVLADRNNLRTLLEFVQGKSVGPFRLDMHLVDNTLIFARKEKRWWRKANDSGYGVNFEANFTQPEPGLEDATGHYRVLRYQLGSLNVAVRAEVDTYYEPPEADTDGNITAADVTIAPPIAISGNPSEQPRTDFRAPIQVIRAGQEVPCSMMAELKTLVIREDIYKSVECMDQLWFGRTQHLLVGRYEPGTGIFKRIKYENKKDLFAGWESKYQDGLRKLVTLINELRELLRAQPGPIKCAVLVREERTGPVVVREMEFKERIVHQDSYFKHWDRRRSRPHPQNGNIRGRGHRSSPAPPSGSYGGHRSDPVPHYGNFGGYMNGFVPSHGNFGGHRNSPALYPGSRGGRGNRFVPHSENFRGRGNGSAG